MNCPVCKDEPMIVLEYSEVEIDFCVACQGIWLDAGEIELLFGDAAACAEFLNAGDLAHARGEKPRRCPICDKKMDKAVTSGEPPVVYDRCRAGDGLWFDKGELAAIVSHATVKAAEPIADFLRGMFPEDVD